MKPMTIAGGTFEPAGEAVCSRLADTAATVAETTTRLANKNMTARRRA
jgi:hypothetical protein